MKPDMEEFVPGHTTTHLRDQASVCPSCGKTLAAATSVERGEHTPRPGDIAVCIYCGDPQVYDDALRRRKMTQRELIDVQTSTEWPKLERLMRQIRSRRGEAS